MTGGYGAGMDVGDSIQRNVTDSKVLVWFFIVESLPHSLCSNKSSFVKVVMHSVRGASNCNCTITRWRSSWEWNT